MIAVECTTRSEVGRRRAKNEDFVLHDAELDLLLVCDGVGGHAAGDVASREAAEAVRESLRRAGRHQARGAETLGLLESALRDANQHVVRLAAQKSEWEGMGTTCVAALVSNDGIAVAHAGDSRCYRLRGDRIERLTADHTTEEIARRFFQDDAVSQEDSGAAGVLLQALGRDPDSFRPSTAMHTAAVGDIFLLCSDGLTGELDDEVIRDIVSTADSDEAACDSLIRRASEHGGRDNISVALMRVSSAHERSSATDDDLEVLGLVLFWVLAIECLAALLFVLS